MTVIPRLGRNLLRSQGNCLLFLKMPKWGSQRQVQLFWNLLIFLSFFTFVNNLAIFENGNETGPQISIFAICEELGEDVKCSNSCYPRNSRGSWSVAITAQVHRGLFTLLYFKFALDVICRVAITLKAFCNVVLSV